MQATTAMLRHPAAIAKPPQRVDTLGYIAHDAELHDAALLLKRHRYRGAIVGPSGCGKSITLQALGDELMAHGLSPLPLRLDPDRTQALPMTWRRTIRQARHTDALLLDDYDRLPRWARVWVWFASMRAGAVVVTSRHKALFKTLARPKPTAALLEQLVEQTPPATALPIDYDAIVAQCEGNLHEALAIARLYGETPDLSIRPGKKQAS